jgi:hypothetical protein
MNDIDPDIAEFAKREYGDNCELVKRTEWSYSFKCGPKSYCSISRFMVEKNFEVSASEIQRCWPTMTQYERTDFVSNWWSKRTWTNDDVEILEIIMADGDDRVWRCCTQAFLKHPDRDRALNFLITRVVDWKEEEGPLNYFQVLGMAKDERAVAVILPWYEKYKREVEAEAVIGIPEKLSFGPIPYFPYLMAAGALFAITGLPEYEQAIRKYFQHPREQVRWWAEHALEIEGPTTAKRNVEYKKKRENR